MQLPKKFKPMLWRICALALAGALPGLAHAQGAEMSEQELALPGDEPLDLSTPLLDPSNGKAKSPKPLATIPRTDFNAKVGIDYRKPAISTIELKPDQLLAGVTPEQSTGVAWANVTASELPLGWDKASIDTRLDPSQEQGKFGTTLSRSVPLGESLAVTLQNGLSVSRTLANPAQPASQSWTSSQALRFSILPTDTTLSIGANMSSTDDKWLRTFGAEQKLFGGPFSVSGSVSETTSGDISKSLKAGFKRSW